MRRIKYVSIIMAVGTAVFCLKCITIASAEERNMQKIKLAEPNYKGSMTVAQAVKQRRSERSYADKPLSKEQLSQMAWCAQGITDANGHKRAAPSAGATYPLELYVVLGEKTCGDLPAGVYRYLPEEHALVLHLAGDQRKPLAAAALGQNFVAQVPLAMVLAVTYTRTTGRYGKRGIMYVHMEAGHVGENVHLQAEALGLGTCMVGAFNDAKVSTALNLPTEHEPLYIMPVGYPR